MSAVATPILPSRDFDETAAFWALLGFTERGRWPDEYLIQRHPSLGIELHFWYSPRVDRWTNDVACYVRFDSPAAALACHQGWRVVTVPPPAELSTPRQTPWGAVEFYVIDPHGNLVRIGGFPPEDDAAG